MRLGVLGPSDGDLVLLAQAAQVLLDEAQVDRVIYLGADDALDRVVAAWARELVGMDPRDSLIFDRAAHVCADAPPDEIEGFVAGERARRRLRVFTTVPPPPRRTMELFDGRVAVIVHDKALLDEDDIAGASFLIFGRSETPIVHRVGSRTFVAPGPLSQGSEGGIAVLDDQGGSVTVELLDPDGGVKKKERLDPRLTGAKLRVQ
ncbi:MAG TPA: hypothetical protein VL400_18655 [Polyangiaceae bacterium]|jgi:hypothetical protein|nr:hypothetical protein [Polyangiaceae bacterium]